MSRIIAYRSSRTIRSDNANIGDEKAQIVQSMSDFRMNNPGVSYRESGQSRTVTDDEGNDVPAWTGTITLEMKTTLNDEAADRDTLAQAAVDLEFAPDKPTAKNDISTRTV
jgi:hypothetical protein